MLSADKMSVADGWSRQATQLAATHTAVGMGVISAQQAPVRQATPSRTSRAWKAPSYRSFMRPEGHDQHGTAANQLQDYQDYRDDHHSIAAVAAGLRRSAPKLVHAAKHGDPMRLTEQAVAVDQAIATLGRDPDDAGEEIARRDNEIRSLEASLELTLSENADLSARLMRREAEVSELKFELGQFQAALTAITGERDTLQRAIEQADADKNTAVSEIRADLDRATVALATAAAERDTITTTLNKVNEQRKIETNAFMSQLYATYSRAVVAEQQLAETQQRLRIRSEETNQTIRDNEQLSRRVAEGGALLETLSSQLKRAKSTLSSAEKRCTTLSAELAEISDRHKTQISALMARLASMSSRAAVAESKLLQARQSLSEKFTLLYRSLEFKARQINQRTHSSGVLLQTADSHDKPLADAGTNIDLLVEKLAKTSIDVSESFQPRATAALLTATISF
jgi:chromosome segregation ATPase